MNLDALGRHFRGEILTPATAGYEAARQIWNGMIDRRPAVIARCQGPEDVVAAVRFAADEDLFPAVRAGGHNVAGLASVNGGFIIDVSAMKGIHIDAGRRIATAQTGLTWGEFDRETQAHGLATTGGVISTTGIAGLTLGGGVGWLMGRCGLSCDNTLAYELVTAAGNSISATADQNSDLFWALKGGGGNFGVVTWISYGMYPITMVVSGMVLYPLVQAKDVLRAYREFVMTGLPDELIVYAAALRTPDGTACIAIIPAYCGSNLDEGERLIAPLKRLGTPLADMISRMPYVAVQQMLDAAAPYGIRSYWKSSFMRSLTDDAVSVFAQFAEACPCPRSIAILEHAHGAATRVPSDATAFSMRSEGLDLVIIGLWDNPADDAPNVQWAKTFHYAMQPWVADSVYVNSLSEDEGGRVKEAYGRNYERLREVKAKYDPLNRFRQNQNIRPQAEAVAAS